jgi:release factor glutamine methyltransferase
MSINQDIYEPAEDSYLIEKHISSYQVPRVLDMGTGSGILAIKAAQTKSTREVIAADLNQNAVNQLKQTIKDKYLSKITPIQSNLFENITGTFDLIIFNAPYLPQDKGIEDLALYGGKKGYETIQEFLKQASSHMQQDGTILLLFSTLTNKPKVEELINNYLFEFKKIDSLKIAFEELYVYEIKKSKLLRELEAKGIKQIEHFTKGQRGLILIGNYNKSENVKLFFKKPQITKVAIKIKNPKSKTLNRIEIEINILKEINKFNIGPKLLISTNDFFVMQFIEGPFLLEYIKQNKNQRDISNKTQNILYNLLNQCHKLDTLKLNKDEMHHPFKHIIIDQANNNRPKPIQIDFERTKKTLSPKNTTQFVEYICRLKEELSNINIEINIEILRNLSKQYKSDMSLKNLNLIKEQIIISF